MVAHWSNTHTHTYCLSWIFLFHHFSTSSLPHVLLYPQIGSCKFLDPNEFYFIMLKKFCWFYHNAVITNTVFYPHFFFFIKKPSLYIFIAIKNILSLVAQFLTKYYSHICILKACYLSPTKNQEYFFLFF